jgi:hypothetical protein
MHTQQPMLPPQLLHLLHIVQKLANLPGISGDLKALAQYQTYYLLLLLLLFLLLHSPPLTLATVLLMLYKTEIYAFFYDCNSGFYCQVAATHHFFQQQQHMISSS